MNFQSKQTKSKLLFKDVYLSRKCPFGVVFPLLLPIACVRIFEGFLISSLV